MSCYLVAGDWKLVPVSSDSDKNRAVAFCIAAICLFFSCMAASGSESGEAAPGLPGTWVQALEREPLVSLELGNGELVSENVYKGTARLYYRYYWVEGIWVWDSPEIKVTVGGLVIQPENKLIHETSIHFEEVFMEAGPRLKVRTVAWPDGMEILSPLDGMELKVGPMPSRHSDYWPYALHHQLHHSPYHEPVGPRTDDLVLVFIGYPKLLHELLRKRAVSARMIKFLGGLVQENWRAFIDHYDFEVVHQRGHHAMLLDRLASHPAADVELLEWILEVEGPMHANVWWRAGRNPEISSDMRRQFMDKAKDELDISYIAELIDDKELPTEILAWIVSQTNDPRMLAKAFGHPGSDSVLREKIWEKSEPRAFFTYYDPRSTPFQWLEPFVLELESMDGVKRLELLRARGLPMKLRTDILRNAASGPLKAQMAIASEPFLPPDVMNRLLATNDPQVILPMLEHSLRMGPIHTLRHLLNSDHADIRRVAEERISGARMVDRAGALDERLGASGPSAIQVVQTAYSASLEGDADALRGIPYQKIDPAVLHHAIYVSLPVMIHLRHGELIAILQNEWSRHADTPATVDRWLGMHGGLTPEDVHWLLENGVPPGDSLYEVVIERMVEDNAKSWIRTILESGVDPNQGPDGRATLLANLIFLGYPDLIRLALEAGADPWKSFRHSFGNHRHFSYFNAFDVAFMLNHYEALEMMDKGGDHQNEVQKTIDRFKVPEDSIFIGEWSNKKDGFSAAAWRFLPYGRAEGLGVSVSWIQESPKHIRVVFPDFMQEEIDDMEIHFKRFPEEHGRIFLRASSRTVQNATDAQQGEMVLYRVK